MCRIRGKNLFNVFKEQPELFNADMFQLMNDQNIEGATYETLKMAVPFELYSEGELFMTSQGGGGGYGDVLERDTALIIKDLEEGVISHETATDLYHLVYNKTNLVVDEAATVEARNAERQARIARGQNWDEFVAEHVRDEPPEGIQYFGSWNGSAELYAGMYGKGLPGQLPPLMMPDPTEVALAEAKAEIAALKAQQA